MLTPHWPTTGDADPSTPNGDDRASFERFLVTFDDLLHQGDPCLGNYVWEANQSTMHHASSKYELTEVGINGH
jgi:hypothetical protein